MRVKSCAAANAADCASRNASCRCAANPSSTCVQRLLLRFQRLRGAARARLRTRTSFSATAANSSRAARQTFLGLRDVRERLGVLRRDFAQAFLVELNPAFVPVNLALQFQSALLLRGDFMFQFRKPFAQLRDFIFKTQHVGGTLFDFVPQFFDGGLLFGNFRLQHVELMPRQLRVEMLQLLRNLFVAARLAGLALQRTDLPLHFADQVGDAQKILLGVFQFAERFLFLRS